MKLYAGKGRLLQGGASRKPKDHAGAQVKAPFEFGMDQGCHQYIKAFIYKNYNSNSQICSIIYIC
jgi:hypothetical protein